MLKKEANANALMEDYSALMAATLNGNLAAIKVLLKHGADISYYNKDSLSAIWLAIPDDSKTTLLLHHGANANQRSAEGCNVLVKLALIPVGARLMQLLIDKGCDVHQSGRLNDVMYNDASTGDTAMIGMLIRNGVSVNDTNITGDHPINSAINYRCFNTLKMLVDIMAQM